MTRVLRHPLRAAYRLLSFCAVNGVGLWNRPRAVNGRVTAMARAEWLRRRGAESLSQSGVVVKHTGTPPTRGMLVANHLSYLDIAVLASRGHMAFVSKAEVRSWPFLGAIANTGGTLFLKREQRSHVAEIAASFRPLIEEGVVVAIFPEGTSSGGDSVLPFRPSLLEPAASNRWPVTPAWLTYDVDPAEGTLADHVAYWRDMTFAPHFLNLLTLTRIRARVAFGEPIEGITDRKQLARALHAAVCRLREEHLDDGRK